MTMMIPVQWMLRDLFLPLQGQRTRGVEQSSHMHGYFALWSVSDLAALACLEHRSQRERFFFGGANEG